MKVPSSRSATLMAVVRCSVRSFTRSRGWLIPIAYGLGKSCSRVIILVTIR